MCGAVAGFIRCLLTWVGEKAKSHNRFKAFKAFFFNIKKYIKSNGVFFEKLSFVLCVGQLAEFTTCVFTCVGQKVKPHNRFIAFTM